MPDTSTDPRLMSPLAALGGELAVQPEWFREALQQTPETHCIDIGGARIEAATWGPRGAPGVLLLHGMGGHKDWWSFIAPALANKRRVTALSLSGAGGSDWRPAYSIPGHARELFAVAHATGLYDSGVSPAFVGHSFGGVPVIAAAALSVELGEAPLSRAVLIDCAIRGPRPESGGRVPGFGREHRIYPNLADALARFRYVPPQICENLYITDHIARRSVKSVPGGWSWKFDPHMWDRLAGFDATVWLSSPLCPLWIITGADSSLMRPSVRESMKATAPAATAWIDVPDAGHHVMADQPQRFIEVLRSILT